MIALIQRVSSAHVEVEQKTVGAINDGLLAFLGVEKHDDRHSAERLIRKIIAYRVFNDAAGKMNLCLRDVQGALLLVPQFTLVADTQRGNRPSFSRAASPSVGQERFIEAVEFARQETKHVACGIFGADMRIYLTNEGPVTFWLHV